MYNKPLFSFGKNWLHFTKKYFDEDRVTDAKKSLTVFLGNNTIKGKTFIDIGCGSGLFSLAAKRLGASKIYSFDIDQNSVECCKYLALREGNPKNWTIICGSILDNIFIKKIKKFDIVYSYGVLHHTGNIYKAINNASKLVKSGGLFHLGIYNKTDIFGIYPPWSFGSSKFWEWEKRTYSNLPDFIQKAIDIIFSITVRIIKIFVKNKKSRGMIWKTDLKDWLGGYPYEYARVDEIFLFLKKLGFTLENLKTEGGLKNNEFLFKKNLS